MYVFLYTEIYLHYYVMAEDETNDYAQDTPTDEPFYVYFDNQ